MNKAKVLVSVALGALLILCGFGMIGKADAQTKPTTKIVKAPVVLTEANDGTTVTVEEGQEVRIDLEGKGSTGYSWSVTATTGNAVTQNGKVTTSQRAPANGGHPIVGASEVFSARFDAVKRGTSKVSLEYKRPWEKKAKPAKTFDVTIKVVPAAKSTKP